MSPGQPRPAKCRPPRYLLSTGIRTGIKETKLNEDFLMTTINAYIAQPTQLMFETDEERMSAWQQHCFQESHIDASLSQQDTCHVRIIWWRGVSARRHETTTRVEFRRGKPIWMSKSAKV